MRRSALPAAFLVLSACAGAPGEHIGSTEQANTCATGTTLQGVDVSVYDGNVDWTEVKSSGGAFGIAKATEGATLTDGEFATNWPAMKAAGVVRSAYHFFHCDSTPASQASYFLGVMGPLQPGDLPPSLDFEDTTTCTPETGISLAIEWLDAVAAATGTLPILYTSVNVLSQFDDTASLAGHAQLWVASRGVTCPNLPAPFVAWSFWQYSLTGTAAGLPNSNGMADLDEFNGDAAALLALTVGGGSDAGPVDAGAPACDVDGSLGVCIDTSLCAMMPGYVSTPGFCPGPADEQCCTPTTASSSSGSSSTSSPDGSASSQNGSASSPGGSMSSQAESTSLRQSSENGGSASESVMGGGASSASDGPTPGSSGGCATTPAPAPPKIPTVAGVLLAAVIAASRRAKRNTSSSASAPCSSAPSS